MKNQEFLGRKVFLGGGELQAWPIRRWILCKVIKFPCDLLRIARLESGTYRNLSLSFLRRVIGAPGVHPHVKFEKLHIQRSEHLGLRTPSFMK
jgi:hypothetical protein